jgi:hypothetical protein
MFNGPIGNGNKAFVYLALIGEPAFGNVMFMDRPSGNESPSKETSQ